MELLQPFLAMGRGGEGVAECVELVAQQYAQKKDNAFNKPAPVAKNLHS